MKQRAFIVIICIIFFAVAGLTLRNFPFSEGDLDKAKPPLITSYDVFANTEHIKWIYDSEQAYYYNAARTGGTPHVIATHPTLYYLFIATFTKLTTLSPYQTAYLAVNILSIIIILQVFLIVRKLFSDDVALISLAFGAIPAQFWLFPMYIGFQYDYFTFITLPVLLFLFIHRFETTLSRSQKILLYALFGFLFTEQFLGHYVELFFYAPFFAVVPLPFWFLKKITLKEYLSAFVIITLILMPFILYFLPLTMKDHLRGGITTVTSQLSSEGSKHIDYFPWPRFDFWLNTLSIVGIIILILRFRTNFTTDRSLYLLFLLYLLFIGFSNYTLHVWANRSERQLFQGYPFLVLFPSLGIVALMKTLLKTIKQEHRSMLVTLTIAFFIFVQNFTPTYATLTDIHHGAFVDDAKWQSIAWIRDHTPPDSRIFALSGFEHEFSMLTERVNLKGDLNRGYTVENIKSLCSRKYPETYLGEWAFREYGLYGIDTYVQKRTGILSFTDVVEPFQNASEGYVFTGPDRGNQSVPLTFFDYVLLQYQGTGFDPCMLYFLNESIARGHSIVWNNNEMAIVKIDRTKNVKPYATKK